MKNDNFIKLRKDKHISQKQLAERMFLPVNTIRKWEYGESLPSLDDMKLLALELETDLETIFFMFEPAQTKVAKEQEIKSKMQNTLQELFWGCDNFQKFALFSYFFTKSKGVMSFKNELYSFNRVIADGKHMAVLLIDDSNNCVVFTEINTEIVNPISTSYNIFTFNIIVNCPIFPKDCNYSSKPFTQEIRISYINCYGE